MTGIIQGDCREVMAGMEPESVQPFPSGPYEIILADPPWKYKDRSLSHGGGAESHYSVLTLKQIIALPIASLAATDSLLFLWATMPLLPDALEVMAAWGFEYKTCAFTWIKTTSNVGAFHWGMGNWTRSNPELCLLGIKGKPKRASASVHSVILAPVGEHSRKPSVVRDRIVELCGDKPRIELFARQKALGWDVWGNEAPDEQAERARLPLLEEE